MGSHAAVSGHVATPQDFVNIRSVDYCQSSTHQHPTDCKCLTLSCCCARAATAGIIIGSVAAVANVAIGGVATMYSPYSRRWRRRWPRPQSKTSDQPSCSPPNNPQFLSSIFFLFRNPSSCSNYPSPAAACNPLPISEGCLLLEHLSRRFPTATFEPLPHVVCVTWVAPMSRTEAGQ
jgi:hypothetical protein